MPGTCWSIRQVELLKFLLAQGLAPSEMEIDSRTPPAIHNKAIRLGLIGDGISRRPWPLADERKLRRLIQRGWTPSRITAARKLPKYTTNAISIKVSRLRLVDPERSRRIRASIRLTPIQQDELQTFLTVHAATRTPEEISLLWNETHYPSVTRGRVIYYLQQLKLKLPWRVVMSMPYSKAKQLRRSPKLIASQEHRWNCYRKLLLQRLTEKARKLRKILGCKLAYRTCSCGSRWPACLPFFTATKKVTRTGRHLYLGRICPLCRNARRRVTKKAEKVSAF